MAWLMWQWLMCYPDLPSAPQNPGYHVQHYGPHNVTVTVQWGYPEFDGGVPVNNYTISGTNIMTTTSQINETTLTLPYNARQTIEVAATNCIGTSGMALLTYFEGRLWLHLYLLLQSTKHCCRLDNSHSQFQYDHCQDIVYNPVRIYSYCIVDYTLHEWLFADLLTLPNKASQRSVLKAWCQNISGKTLIYSLYWDDYVS